MSVDAGVLRQVASAMKAVGVTRGSTVFLTGNFGRPGPLGLEKFREVLPCYFRAAQLAVGDTGTIVVPAHSWSLRHSGEVFNPLTTSSESGPFTELVRREVGSARSFHAFASVVAVGYNAERICSPRTRHAYGPGSPWDLLCSENARFVSVGQHPSENISAVHHAEFLAGVPYRYTREFFHPCESLEGLVSEEQFLLQVLYSGVRLERDGNKRFFEAYKSRFDVPSAPIGRSAVYSVELEAFLEIALQLLARDIYAWLRFPPSERPWSRWL